ncbi:MAG: DUF1178 family protein [Rhizobiaceae bacterium]
MISFTLVCSNAHEFEAWFSSGNDFDEQKDRGLVECPYCSDKSVEKSLMAPSVSTSRSKEQSVPVAMNAEQKKMMAQLRELTNKMREGAENVGDKFAEEARKIHYGETEARGIYGKATPVEAKGLAEEGVEFIPLPTLPEDQN